MKYALIQFALSGITVGFSVWYIGLEHYGAAAAYIAVAVFIFGVGICCAVNDRR